MLRFSVLIAVVAACTHPVVLQPGAVDHALPRGEPGALDRAAVDQILAEAADEGSTAVVIAQNGKIVVERYRAGYAGKPLVAMSASKSVVALAVGRLVAQRKLALDTPIAALFPDVEAWRDPMKARITVRHLLTQTSGLEPSRAQFDTGETIRDHAARARVVFEPGSHFQYSNGGVDLLALVVERAASMPLDAYLEREIFAPLDIVGAYWMKDSTGTPRGAGELFIRPVDLVKLGQLMLDGGRWNGAEILPAEWVAAMVAPSQADRADYGLLWWREGSFASVLDDSVLAGWAAAGVDAEVIERARPMIGRAYADPSAYRQALVALVGHAGFARLNRAIRAADHVALEARTSVGTSTGFSARGWLGQYLVVIPGTRIVAVRMRAPKRDDYGTRANEDTDAAFPREIAALTK